METVAIVPARGGSKGLVGKNLAIVNGRSLVARAVEVGLAATGIDLVYVSSDDEAILSEGQAAGAIPHLRPTDLAGDETTTLDVLRWFAEQVPADQYVILQPTSPLRVAEDVASCLLAIADAPSCVTVSPSAHPASWTFRLDGPRLEPVLGWDALDSRRQAVSEYTLNGAVYVVRHDHLASGGALVGPGTVAVVTSAERSIDIDDALDLQVADLLARGAES